MFGAVVGASLDNQQQLSIKRIFAKGGFVITEYVDFKDNELKFRMLAPSEAARRAAALIELGRRSAGKVVRSELVEAITKAALAARAQSDAGLNPLLNQNRASEAELDRQAREIMAEIVSARRADPALDEEMTRLETA